MRLIDADALIVELNRIRYPGVPYIDAGIRTAIGKVCDAPTIEEVVGYHSAPSLFLQSEERQTDKWIVSESEEVGALGIRYKSYKCPFCGWENSLIIPRNFCPKCGARLKEVR